MSSKINKIAKSFSKTLISLGAGETHQEMARIYRAVKDLYFAVKKDGDPIFTSVARNLWQDVNSVAYKLANSGVKSDELWAFVERAEKAANAIATNMLVAPEQVAALKNELMHFKTSPNHPEGEVIPASKPTAPAAPKPAESFGPPPAAPSGFAGVSQKVELPAKIYSILQNLRGVDQKDAGRLINTIKSIFLAAKGKAANTPEYQRALNLDTAKLQGVVNQIIEASKNPNPALTQTVDFEF